MATGEARPIAGAYVLTAYFGCFVWYPARTAQAEKPHSNGQKPSLHAAAGRGDGCLGLDVRRGPGCDLRLRRPRFPSPAFRARERRARAASPGDVAPDAARGLGDRAGPRAGKIGRASCRERV